MTIGSENKTIDAHGNEHFIDLPQENHQFSKTTMVVGRPTLQGHIRRRWRSPNITRRCWWSPMMVAEHHYKTVVGADDGYIFPHKTTMRGTPSPTDRGASSRTRQSRTPLAACERAPLPTQRAPGWTREPTSDRAPLRWAHLATHRWALRQWARRLEVEQNIAGRRRAWRGEGGVCEPWFQPPPEAGATAILETVTQHYLGN